jgi:hypothetical protein
MNSLLFVIAVGLGACSAERLSLDLSTTTVELDVFSGRPNPRWQLTAEQINQLEDRLTGLREITPVEIPNQLGYRGFRIQDENSGNRITVTNNGYVVLHHDNGDKFYRDTKNVEEWLKQNAKAHGHGNPAMEAQ